MTDGYACVPHQVWELDISPDERYMLLFLIDRENKFNRVGEWFCLTNAELIGIGFGKNKTILRKTRESLVAKGLIDYEQGGPGKKSRYKILWV